MLRNRSMPACTVIPEFAYSNVDEAIDWLCETFGFTLRLQIADHRAQLNVGDGAIVIRHAEAVAVHSACSVMVRVDDIDGHYENARHRGARILSAPADYPYGERQYSVEDLAGHHWTFSQSIADVDPREWGGITGKV